MNSYKTSVALFIGMSFTAPSWLTGQAGTIFVLEVPVEIRTLSPEVTQAFVECSLKRQNQALLGTARTGVRIEAGKYGGSVSESAEVAFRQEHMQGDPVRPETYECWVVLKAEEGTEALAVMGADDGYATSYTGDQESNWDVLSRENVDSTSVDTTGATRTDCPGCASAPTLTNTPPWSHMQWSLQNLPPGTPVGIGGYLEERVRSAIYEAWLRAGEGK